AHAQLLRQNNTTLKFPAAITSTGQYELVDLLPNIQFDRPVCVASPPGSQRLFVVERVGRVWLINDLNAPAKELFLDLTDRVHAASWSVTIVERKACPASRFIRISRRITGSLSLTIRLRRRQRAVAITIVWPNSAPATTTKPPTKAARSR